MISKEKFAQMKFTSFGFLEPLQETVSYRLPSGHVLQTKSNAELRNLISNVVHDKKEETGLSITNLVECECNIPLSTYRQYISGKNRHPTRPFLLKLCVGLKLSLEQANELLRAHSGELNVTNDVDAITYYALLDGDSVYDYEEELLEKANVKPKI